MLGRGAKNLRDPAGWGPRLVPGLSLRAGQVVGDHFRVSSLVGASRAGLVFEATHLALGVPALLKVFASYTEAEEQALAPRLAKARLATSLRGLHVEHVFAVGVTEDGMPFVATERVAGSTLEAEIATHGPLGVQAAVRRVLEACEGLAEAHAAGLVHGGVTPKSLVLAEGARPAPGAEGEADRRVLKVLDFGGASPLASVPDADDVPTGSLLGSPAFLSPEQIKDPNAAGARADLWALGVILHQAATGLLPFEAESVSGLLVAVVYDEPKIDDALPAGLAQIIARCLSKDPEERPADVGELAEALAPFAANERVGRRLSERVAVYLEDPSLAAVDVTPDARWGAALSSRPPRWEGLEEDRRASVPPMLAARIPSFAPAEAAPAPAPPAPTPAPPAHDAEANAVTTPTPVSAPIAAAPPPVPAAIAAAPAPPRRASISSLPAMAIPTDVVEATATPPDDDAIIDIELEDLPPARPRFFTYARSVAALSAAAAMLVTATTLMSVRAVQGHAAGARGPSEETSGTLAVDAAVAPAPIVSATSAHRAPAPDADDIRPDDTSASDDDARAVREAPPAKATVGQPAPSATTPRAPSATPGAPLAPQADTSRSTPRRDATYNQKLFGRPSK